MPSHPAGALAADDRAGDCLVIQETDGRVGDSRRLPEAAGREADTY